MGAIRLVGATSESIIEYSDLVVTQALDAEEGAGFSALVGEDDDHVPRIGVIIFYAVVMLSDLDGARHKVMVWDYVNSGEAPALAALHVGEEEPVCELQSFGLDVVCNSHASPGSHPPGHV